MALLKSCCEDIEPWINLGVSATEKRCFFFFSFLEKINLMVSDHYQISHLNFIHCVKCVLIFNPSFHVNHFTLIFLNFALSTRAIFVSPGFNHTQQALIIFSWSARHALIIGIILKQSAWRVSLAGCTRAGWYNSVVTYILQISAGIEVIPVVHKTNYICVHEYLSCVGLRDWNDKKDLS